MDEYENIGPAVNVDTPLQPPPPDGDKIKSENVRDKSNDEKVATKKSGLSLKGSEYAIDKPKSVETTTQTKKKSDKAKSGTKSGDKAKGSKKKDKKRNIPPNMKLRNRILFAISAIMWFIGFIWLVILSLASMEIIHFG